MNDDTTEMNACLFPDLTSSSLLDALGGFTEASKGRVPVLGPALLAAEQDVCVCVVHNGADDGRVCAGEAEVGDAFAGCAGRTSRDVLLGGGGCGYLCGFREVDQIVGGTYAFEAAIDRESRVAALCAERVAEVPVKKLAGFGIDGSWRRVSA